MLTTMVNEAMSKINNLCKMLNMSDYSNEFLDIKCIVYKNINEIVEEILKFRKFLLERSGNKLKKKYLDLFYENAMALENLILLNIKFKRKHVKSINMEDYKFEMIQCLLKLDNSLYDIKNNWIPVLEEVIEIKFVHKNLSVKRCIM